MSNGDGECVREVDEAVCRWCVGIEVQFNSIEFAEAFDGLNDLQKQRIAVYSASASPTEVAKQTGGSPGYIGKVIKNLVTRLGGNSASDVMKVNKISNKQNTASASRLMQLIERQGYRCALSGVELTPENSSLDHKVPMSAGGTNDIENLQWLHKGINSMKSTLDQTEFIELCRKVTAWNR